MSLCLTLPFLNSTSVSAREMETGCPFNDVNNIQDNPEIIDKYLDESEYQVYVYSDGVKVMEKGDSFIVIIPEYATNYEPPETMRSITIGTIWAVISNVLTACTIIEWTFGDNPCEIAYKYLIKLLGSNAKTGQYKITGTYHSGYIPGCEPRNSLPCNSGYYEYQFIAS